MNNDTFQLAIVSPERMVFSGEVYSAQVPGAEGDFGVLAGHAPVLSVVRSGVIRVDLGQAGKHAYFVTSGYAEVNSTSCTILSEHVQNLAEISTEEAEDALAHAKRVFDHAETDAERVKAQALVEKAEALLAALKA